MVGFLRGRVWNGRIGAGWSFPIDTSPCVIVVAGKICSLPQKGSQRC